MALTPVEIRHITFGKSLVGYKRDAVDKLLADVALSFEDVWRERADLADKVEQLESDLVRYKELEALLRTTLVSAERASAEMREQARKEADLILSEAHAASRAVLRESTVEHERLKIESRRMRARLRLALASIDEALDEDLDAVTEDPATTESEAAQSRTLRGMSEARDKSALLSGAAPEGRPRVDIRVGSVTDGLTPISVAERPLGAT